MRKRNKKKLPKTIHYKGPAWYAGKVTQCSDGFRYVIVTVGYDKNEEEQAIATAKERGLDNPEWWD